MVRHIAMMSAKLSQLIVAIFLLRSVLYVSALPSSRIVGGEDADIGQFPHQVALFVDGNFYCGGSILNERYVLTAAHCVVVSEGLEALPARYFTVRVGSIQRQTGGKLFQIKRVIVRKSYGNFLDDVALLELQEKLTFTKNIQPIELYDDELPPGESVIVSGWGRLVQGGAIPNRMQFITLSVISGEECDELIGYGFDQIICLAHPRGSGACNGDSGGPATYNDKLVGVAGFVYGGCANIYPDGYAKVSYHREWIEANMV